MMHRFSCIAIIAVFVLVATSSGFAEPLKGRLASTVLAGFVVPADSEFQGPPKSVASTDAAFGIGGGFLYGIDSRVALEFLVSHTEFDGDVAGSHFGSFDINYYAIGAQYRFASPQPRLVPYLGGGIDIISSDFTRPNGIKADVDTVPGFHLAAGADYFLTKQLALVGEARIIVAPDADITIGGTKIGTLDPMNISMGFGARFFFN